MGKGFDRMLSTIPTGRLQQSRTELVSAVVSSLPACLQTFFSDSLKATDDPNQTDYRCFRKTPRQAAGSTRGFIKTLKFVAGNLRHRRRAPEREGPREFLNSWQVGNSESGDSYPAFLLTP